MPLNKEINQQTFKKCLELYLCMDDTEHSCVWSCVCVYVFESLCACLFDCVCVCSS